MRIAMISTITRPTPSRQSGPRENMVSVLTEGLVQRGMDITLFAVTDSQNHGKSESACPDDCEENKTLLPSVSESLHISEVFEQGNAFDLIHNHLDYLPLTYIPMTTTPVVTTIHGFLSPQILPVYQKYNNRSFYVAISEAQKSPALNYTATIFPGIDTNQFIFNPEHGKYLLFFGPIQPEKDIRECIEIAHQTGKKLILAGIGQDLEYFDQQIKPFIDNDRVIYAGNVGPEKRNELLSNALALLYPNKVDEPFGLPVVEAMACGTPAVAINRGSLSEIITDGITGFIADDINEMAEKVSRVHQLDRTRCRQRIENHFSTDHMVENYLRVYEKIVEQTRREDHRPWGFYEILSDKPDHKVKRITVYPGQRLSYQRHFRRSEHWYLIEGRAIVTQNGKDIELSSGQSIDLPVGTWHRVRNPGTDSMVFIEVQTGDYFGEDDIERSEDDYGRK